MVDHRRKPETGPERTRRHGWDTDNKKNGRGGWIRTNAWQDQNLLPYRLATPLYRHDQHDALSLVEFPTIRTWLALQEWAPV